MPGLVHVIDDDVCFLTAMERRLKYAGYEVATYVSSRHFLDRLPSEVSRAAFSWTCKCPDWTVRHCSHG